MLVIPELFLFSSNIMKGFATQPLHLILASPFSISIGTFVPVLISLVGDLTDPSTRPDALGSYYFFSSVGIFLGPITASLLILVLPIRYLYYFSAILRLVIIVLIVVGVNEVTRTLPDISTITTSYKHLLRRTNMLVALIATYRGYSSERTTSGVSNATTTTVVSASVCIVFADYVITALWGF